MKDRFYMVLAFIGLIILCVVYVLNYESNGENAIFEPDSYYQPAHSSSGENAVLLYSQMTGARSITCPQKSFTTSSSNIFVNTQGAYGVKCFFLPDSDVNMGKWDMTGIDSCLQSAHKNESSCKLNEFINTTGEYNSLRSDVYMIPASSWNSDKAKFEFEDESSVPIYTFVAPFDFNIDNTNVAQNSARNDTIVLINTTGSCRITLNYIANWFCAGEVGVQRKVSNGTDSDILEWYEHINGPHNTIVGGTGNSDLKSGKAGTIIAYVTPDTEITFEKFEGNSWKPLPIYNFFHD